MFSRHRLSAAGFVKRMRNKVEVLEWADGDGSTVQFCVDYENFNVPNV